MSDAVSESQPGFNKPEKTSTQVVFLGFAERSENVRYGETNVSKTNVIGLTDTLLVNFVPISLVCWVGVAFRYLRLPETLKIAFRTGSGHEIFSLQIDLASSDSIATSHGWAFGFFPMPSNPPTTILNSGRHFAVLQRGDNSDEVIGEFDCRIVEPPPLTAELIAAIKSHPRGIRAVRTEYFCTTCRAGMKIYTAFERDLALERSGYVWYTAVPDRYSCKCGKTEFDFSTLKRNFFALLLQPIPLSKELSGIPLYERSSVESLRVTFLKILNSNPPEETLQKFIEENPIILQQFTPDRLFFKPAILMHFNADFAVINPEKELVLIEIERADTRLLKNDGGQHSQLTHAIDQIHSWLGCARSNHWPESANLR